MSIWVVVDVESDGPCPGVDMYSMISFGAVVLDKNLDKTFYGETAPISKLWIPEALAISNISREQHEAYDKPEIAIHKFAKWLEDLGDRVVFISDNPAFDCGFMNYYLHKYAGRNPFGFSARRIGDMYSGIVNDAYQANNWKKFRKTKHTHNPVDDAIGNAEALLEFNKRFNFNAPLAK